MRFVLGPPANSLTADELASGEWHCVRQLPVWAMQLAALPVGFVIATVLFCYWVAMTPKFDVASDPSEWVTTAIIAVLLAGPVLQLVIYPPSGAFRQSYLGLWPSRLLIYTGTTAKTSRMRYLLALSGPFLLLALGPLYFVSVTNLQSGWLVFISCLSALLYGLPALRALVISRRMPRGAQVAGIGFQTYWRMVAR